MALGRRTGAQDVRLVMHADGPPAAWFATPFARAALSALGLTPEHILYVDRPVRFRAADGGGIGLSARRRGAPRLCRA